jgi:4-diphosphocytidyl-2-C-methyl-D-erythritol kinase
MSANVLLDVPAPAKLNLFLHVVGQRADGYHLLQSAFALIDWSDTLHFERRADGRLARHDLGAVLPEDDLCLRAARRLQAESGTAYGADISIDKCVPWGAGLGGGSSDAASTLLALNRLWGLHWPRERLLALGLALGADVPFFLGGMNAWVEGIGERLTPVELPARWWAVLKPAVALPTAAIFGSPTLVRNTPAATILDFLADPLGFGRNDLQGPAEGYSSEVSKALALLQARFGASRMTGSGSAVFAEVGAVDRAPRDRVEAMPLPAAWTGRTCRGLSRHPLADWAQG